MKLYKGSRTAKGCAVTVTDGDGKTYDLPPRTDIKDYTIDGTFEWAYNGQGPSQLALAIIADATGKDDYALEACAQFRFLVISRLPFNGWEMSEPQLREFF